MSDSKKLIVGITAEGSVNLLQGQLAHFKSLGYTTYLLGPWSERSAKFCKDEGCEHLVINIEREISPLKDLKSLFQIIKIFRKVKPDIINLGTPKVSLLGMIAGTLVNVPKRIYTCRGFRFEHEKGLKKRLLINIEKLINSLSHKTICISPSLKEFSIKNRIFKEKKTLVIVKGSSNGINLKNFKNKNVSAKKNFKETNSFIFGFVGRLVKDKGIFELLEVFIRINSKFPNTKLLILGSTLTSTENDIKELKKYENHSSISWLGFRENIYDYISLFDVLVVPTYREGFGNVFIESAALGVPVISTDIIGVKDAVSHGYNGILIPVKNKDKLQEAMLELLQNPEQRQVYAEHGKLWAQNFDRQLIWEGMDNIYKA